MITPWQACFEPQEAFCPPIPAFWLGEPSVGADGWRALQKARSPVQHDLLTSATGSERNTGFGSEDTLSVLTKQRTRTMANTGQGLTVQVIFPEIKNKKQKSGTKYTYRDP